MGARTTADSGTEDNDKVRKINVAGKKPPEENGGEQRPQESHPADAILTFNDNPVKYDVPAIARFLETVFHVEPLEGAELFVQINKRAPAGFGVRAQDALTGRLAKTEAPMPAYYSTSMLSINEDGTFRHTKQAFKSWHVLVLDDIGTKIPFDKIPEHMAENYRIESSEGNFQLGYILREPITDYEEAQALISLFVDAGYSDGGGAMPVKKVRLPCGVNGKAGERGAFHVKLHELNDDYWDVQELLDAAGIDVNWEAYRKTVHDKAHRVRRLGASAWVPDLYHVNPQTGVYDPVLEFMYSKGMVIQDGQERFMDVICPFHEEHSEQDLKSKQCGYSPLGHGAYPHKRVFSCFHDSCKSYVSADYIQRLHLLGGPLMPVSEYRPENVVNCVYDTVNDRVYDITESGTMHGRQVAVINRITPKVPVPGPNGEKLVDQLPLWLKQPSSVKVAGAIYDASNRSRIVQDTRGQLRVNLYDAVDYPPVTPDPKHVDMFKRFMDYLIPSDDEREYVLKWLACKVQNPTFRGAALVLVSQAQGTGKNTLMKLIDKLFGGNATTQMNMDALINGGDFNEWVMSQFVNVNESLAVNDVRTSRRSYNKLKELVDPAPMKVVANPKYGTKVDVTCTTSFLFFSNHIDAVYLHEGDRRFYAAQGPDVPASAEFFEEIYQWLESEDWMQHLWWYLKGQEISMAEMMQAPPTSRMMEEVRFEATSPLEAVIKAGIAVWPAPMVPPSKVQELLVQYIPRGIPENYKAISQRMIGDQLRSLAKTPGVSRAGGVRLSLKPEYAGYMSDESWLIDAHGETVHKMRDYTDEQFKQDVDEWLIEKGYDF